MVIIVWSGYFVLFPMMMCAYMLNHTLNYLRFLVSDMYYDFLESYLINYKILPIAGSLSCHMINLPTLLFLGVHGIPLHTSGRLLSLGLDCMLVMFTIYSLSIILWSNNHFFGETSLPLLLINIIYLWILPEFYPPLGGGLLGCIIRYLLALGSQL